MILVAAKLGGEAATRLGQPAVLGELLAGVALGNLDLLGVGLIEPMQAGPTVNILAGIGVLLLLLELGLGSTVRDMMKVWLSSVVAGGDRREAAASWACWAGGSTGSPWASA